MPATILLPSVVVAAVLAADVWVYVDAQRKAAAGTPVVFRVGSFVIDTPTSWFLGCLVLWIVFFPLYLNGRT